MTGKVVVRVKGRLLRGATFIRANQFIYRGGKNMTRQQQDPLLDAGVRGLIVNMAKKNFWRVASWYDLQDLIQDGYLCFAKVRNRYPTATDVRHVTALFKTTFFRHITDLANERTQGNEQTISQLVAVPGQEEAVWERLIGGQDEEATLKVMLRNAPAELRALYRFLSSEDGRRRLSEPYRWRYGVRETTNQYLCRKLGFDANTVNLEEMARNYLLPA